MRISDKTAVQSILFHLKEEGIRHVVYSPGSRNAPFAISLDQNPDFEIHIVVDERSAAFVALGMAQQLNKAVALICTSGTAPLNYAPAVAEAYYQEIPLLIFTADRPAESIDQGEGQCIRQNNIYQNFCKASYHLIEEAESNEEVHSNHQLVAEAVRGVNDFPKGPIHVNVPFKEPLYRTSSASHPKAVAPVLLDQKEEDVLNIPSFEEQKRYLIVVGQNRPDAGWKEVLRKALSFSNITVLTESHGNVQGEGAIDQIDRWIMSLSDDQKNQLHWDVIISLGHNVISRKVKSLIREKVKEHWSLQFQTQPIDTYRKNPTLIPLEPTVFLNKWLPEVPEGIQPNPLHRMNQRHQTLLPDYFSKRPHSDARVFYQISQTLPSGAQVQMGNSSAVRYLQLMEQRSDLTYFGNRGVSGIDGCTSTAVGAALATHDQVFLITGDLSFLYDANALWQQQWPSNLKVIIIDNGGGGIFRIIEGAKAEPSVPVLFETPHSRDIHKWIQGWGLNALEYHETTQSDFIHFFNQTESAMMIVKTQAELNPIELDLFFQYFNEYNERMENH